MTMECREGGTVPAVILASLRFAADADWSPEPLSLPVAGVPEVQLSVGYLAATAKLSVGLWLGGRDLCLLGFALTTVSFVRLRLSESIFVELLFGGLPHLPRPLA